MKTVRRGPATVLSLDTEDLSRPPQVEAAFEEVLAVLRRRSVIVDLRQVTRLTSMGLSALSAGAAMARGLSAHFTIAGARPEVRHLIEALDTGGEPEGGARGGRIEITEDVESALRTLDDEPRDA